MYTICRRREVCDGCTYFIETVKRFKNLEDAVYYIKNLKNPVYRFGWDLIAEDGYYLGVKANHSFTYENKKQQELYDYYIVE